MKFCVIECEKERDLVEITNEIIDDDAKNGSTARNETELRAS